MIFSRIRTNNLKFHMIRKSTWVCGWVGRSTCCQPHIFFHAPLRSIGYLVSRYFTLPIYASTLFLQYPLRPSLNLLPANLITLWHVSHAHQRDTFMDVQNHVSCEIHGSYRLVPAQDVHFFYTRSRLSALQKCALLFSINFQFFSYLKNA